MTDSNGNLSFPSLTEDLKAMGKALPIAAFGLTVYTIKLWRGTISHELRKSIIIALTVGWCAVALTACLLALVVLSKPAPEPNADIAFVLGFSFFVKALCGILIYNRVHAGFYL